MDAAGDGVVVNDNYQRHLALIKAQPWRNRHLDGSPFLQTPQADLDISDSSPLLGPRSAYLGAPNGNPEQDFPTPEGGQNRTSCEFSHFAYDDPIVNPGQPGVAHLHMFFGNTDVNAYSTHGTLINSGSSTCNGAELNRTGYWAPAMFDGNGNVRIPERVVVYYKGEGFANGARNPGGGGAKPYKPGMANISPNPITVPEVGNGEGGAIGEVNFKCSNNFSAFPPTSTVNEIPNCNGNYWRDTFGAPYPETRMVLEVVIKFWNCFPRDAVVEDWKSWKAAGPTRGGWYYSNCNGAGGGEPANMDIYPNLEYFINYVVEPGEDTSQWFLSSDVDSGIAQGGPARLVGAAGGTTHADWWGGWHPEINKEWSERCVNFQSGQPSGCGFGYLSTGGPDGANPLPGRALRYRAQYDKVGASASYKVPARAVFEALCAPLNPEHAYTSDKSAAYCVPQRRL